MRQRQRDRERQRHRERERERERERPCMVTVCCGRSAAACLVNATGCGPPLGVSAAEELAVAGAAAGVAAGGGV